jgi:hypothetical protein
MEIRHGHTAAPAAPGPRPVPEARQVPRRRRPIPRPRCRPPVGVRLAAGADPKPRYRDHAVRPEQLRPRRRRPPEGGRLTRGEGPSRRRHVALADAQHSSPAHCRHWADFARDRGPRKTPESDFERAADAIVGNLAWTALRKNPALVHATLGSEATQRCCITARTAWDFRRKRHQRGGWPALLAAAPSRRRGHIRAASQTPMNLGLEHPSADAGLQSSLVDCCWIRGCHDE